MPIRHTKLNTMDLRLPVLLCLATLLGACATTQRDNAGRYSQHQDTAPARAVDVSQVADATPRVEPKSRYGNPASYVVRGKRYTTQTSSTGYMERGSALLTEAVAGESLERWADGRSTRCPREMIRSLAGYVRKFHECGYAHRDLYLCHIFIDESAGDASRFRMIDLHRVIRPVWRRGRWVVKDLAALDYSTPSQVAGVRDRVRFLKWYLGVGRLGAKGRRLFRRIAEKSARIGRHDRRRMARLGGAIPPAVARRRRSDNSSIFCLTKAFWWRCSRAASWRP